MSILLFLSQLRRTIDIMQKERIAGSYVTGNANSQFAPGPKHCRPYPRSTIKILRIDVRGNLQRMIGIRSPNRLPLPIEVLTPVEDRQHRDLWSWRQRQVVQIRSLSMRLGPLFGTLLQ